jgi:hypothetical protein
MRSQSVKQLLFAHHSLATSKAPHNYLALAMLCPAMANHRSRFHAAMLVCTLLLLLPLLAGCDPIERDREPVSNSNQNINVNQQQETMKFGNTKTKNYNYHENNYQPTQHIQVVFNVGKLKSKKSRTSRPPTAEEYAIKQQIMHIYEAALDGLASWDVTAQNAGLAHLKHLGKILWALNPKYIATQRVMDVTFADPYGLQLDVVPPELEFMQQLTKDDQLEQCEQAPRIELSIDGENSIQAQLDRVADRFGSIVSWDETFEQELFRMPDRMFNSTQLAFKRLIQCLVQPAFCKHKFAAKKVLESEHDDHHQLQPNELVDRVVQSASELSKVEVLPPQIVNEEPELAQGRGTREGNHNGHHHEERQTLNEPRVQQKRTQVAHSGEPTRRPEHHRSDQTGRRRFWPAYNRGVPIRLEAQARLRQQRRRQQQQQQQEQQQEQLRKQQLQQEQQQQEQEQQQQLQQHPSSEAPQSNSKPRRLRIVPPKLFFPSGSLDQKRIFNLSSTRSNTESPVSRFADQRNARSRLPTSNNQSNQHAQIE